MKQETSKDYISPFTKDYAKIEVIPLWHPTPLLRWKRVSIDLMTYNKVLQQKWISNTGIKEWRDVPEED
jgi:hypothetical protein